MNTCIRELCHEYEEGYILKVNFSFLGTGEYINTFIRLFPARGSN